MNTGPRYAGTNTIKELVMEGQKGINVLGCGTNCLRSNYFGALKNSEKVLNNTSYNIYLVKFGIDD